MNDEPQRRRTSGGGRHTAGRAPRARQKIALTPARVAQGCVALALGGVLTGLTVHGAAAAQSQRAQMLDARTAVTDAALDAVAVAHAASRAAAGVTVDDGRVAQLEAATAELEKLLDETGVDALRAAGTVSRSAGRAGDDGADDADPGDQGSRAADPVAAGTGAAGEGGASAPTNGATDGAADAAPTGPSAGSSPGSATAPSADPSTQADGLLSASERPLAVPPPASAAPSTAASTPAPPTSAPTTAPSAPTTAPTNAPATAPTTAPTTGSADRAGTTPTAGPTGDATGTSEATAGSSDAARTTPDATTTATTPTATTPVAPDATTAPGATPGSSDQVAQDAVVVPPVEGPEDATTRKLREALARVVELRDAVLETTEDKQAERAAAADAAQQKAAELRVAAAAAEQAKAEAAEAERQAQEEAAAQAAAAAAAERAAWKKSLLGYANGRIPASALCAPTFDAGALLRCDAAQDLDALDAAYYADFGVHVTITDSYRSYASQVTCRATKGWLCATPGTSNHGTGVAVDLGGGIQTFGTKQHRWMKAHAADYGWAHPGWAEPGSSKPEPWHWEYTR